MYEFKLPDLGEGIHEGEILKWHVEAGGTVAEDGPLVDVETDKAAVTLPSPRGGRVVSLGGKPGDTVRVGQVLCVIDDGLASRPQPQVGPSSPAPAPVSGLPVPAAPATRKLARELGVDLSRVPATGPAGRVTAEDVRRFAEGTVRAPSVPREGVATVAAPAQGEAIPPQAGDEESPASAPSAAPVAVGIPFLDLSPLPDFAAQGPVEKEPVRSVRRAIARAMVTSAVIVPHAAHMDEIDVTDLEAFRHREREKRAGQPGGRLTLLAFVAKAVARGLREARSLNASLDPVAEEIVYKRFFHVGVAVDTERGLVVPVVRDLDRKSVLDVAAEIEDLARQARENRLPPAAYRGGTFTITNIGALGGTGMIPVIRYPEAAILGMGRVAERPVVREGRVVVRRMLPVILAFDHRIADGAEAARFVNALARRLADPATLLLEA